MKSDIVFSPDFPVVPVILSGGSGTRLWPLSRSAYPKQFLPLHSDKTLLQETVQRLVDIGVTENPVVVCNEDHRFIVAENFRGMGQKAGQIILEPIGRNTAPAIALAALSLYEKNKESVLLVLPADHVIGDLGAFSSAIEKAIPLVHEGKLVTFGVTPDCPHVGYGYIKKGEQIDLGGRGHESSHFISAFTEKPDEKTARSFIETGEYLWNSGMFLFKASAYIEELEQIAPDILSCVRLSLENGARDENFVRPSLAEFSHSPNKSIDYAVMEKTNRGAVVTLDAKWCDIGSWSALWEIMDKDEEGNVVRGDVQLISCTNNYIYADQKLVTLVGIDDLVVIDTKDSLLVARRGGDEMIRKVVEALKKKGRPEVV